MSNLVFQPEALSLGTGISFDTHPTITRLILFFVFCVPSFYAVRRGLFAIQAYLLFRRARAGIQLPLRRSRFRICTGNFLQGTPLYTFFSIVITLCVVGLATVAIIFVEERNLFAYTETIPNYASISTLYGNSLPPRANASSANSTFRAALLATSLSCTTRDAISIKYWPVAYNLTLDTDLDAFDVYGYRGSYFAACQRGSTHWSSGFILQLNAFSFDRVLPSGSRQHQTFNIHNPYPFVSLTVTTDVKSKKSWSAQVEEYQISNTVTRNEDLSGKVGSFFVYKQSNRSIAVLLLVSRATNSTLISIGTPTFNNDTSTSFTIGTPVQISADIYKDIEIFSEEYNPVRVLRQRLSFEDIVSTRQSIPRLVELLLERGLVGIPLTEPIGSYSPYSITLVPWFPFCTFILLPIFALIFGFMREILSCVLVRRKIAKKSQLFVNDYDELSKTLRREMERGNEQHRSKDFAVLGKREDNDGSDTVHVIIPPVPGPAE